MRILALASLLLSACVCGVPAATASPPAAAVTDSAVPSASASASASPTRSASPSPSSNAAVYVSATGGYRIATTPPLRRSDCLSAQPGFAAETLALDTFVGIPEANEQFGDVGVAFDQIAVHDLRNTQSLTPRQWVDSGKLGSSTGMTIDDSTLDGHPAVRVRNGPSFVVAYVLADRAVLYVISYAVRDRSTIDQALADRTIASFHVLADNERPSTIASPAPSPRSADAVASVLVDGFARKDVDLLATVMASCMSNFGEQAGGTGMPRSRFASQLTSGFAAGSTVAVQAGLQTDQGGTFLRATWSDPGQAPQRRDLYLRDESGRWTWFLVLRRLPPR